MAGKKWSDSSIAQATSVVGADEFLMIQNSSGQSKRINFSDMGTESAQVYVTTSKAVAQNASIPFDGIQNANHITLSTTDITIVNAGTYQINFVISNVSQPS